eukprot:TRINITY_DN14472_c0_g1_i1.p1 TRINITY_DN14472_c0_g1~~TRINITY_DN14472_c0_g1_i1.p1  ORF type:complete len:605 (-),score=135.04 TRINITY_DN14472_c0_g1_i1:318-2132(-)
MGAPAVATDGPLADCITKTAGACQAVAVYDDGSDTVAACRSSAMDVLLRYGEPTTATGCAFFGLGIGALPMLAKFHAVESSSSDGEFCYSADLQEQMKHGSGLFAVDDIKGRIGPLEPEALATELLADSTSVSRSCIQGGALSKTLEADVRHLQSWHGGAKDAIAQLERRAALAYLGLASDAELDAVQKSYKQKALAVHPDKGGSEEDFQHLQAMVNLLQTDSQLKADDLMSGGGGLFSNIMKQVLEQKKPEIDGEEGLSESLKLQRRRLMLHDQTIALWEKANAAQKQLSAGSASRKQGAPAMSLLQKLVSGFSIEIECIPRTPAAPMAAERILYKFVRQGLEVLTVAALIDVAGTVAQVAMQLTGPLLQTAKRVRPCPQLERRCQALLAALGDVPKACEAFLGNIRERLEDQAASEWRGCDESKAPASTLATSANSAPSAPIAAPAEASQREKPCVFKAVVAGAASKAPSFIAAAAPGEREPAVPAASAGPVTAVEVARDDDFQLASKDDVPTKSEENDKYTYTEEWRKLRAFCIRHRFCVDFNRDSADIRCSVSKAVCAFRHECATCGLAGERGGPGSQHMDHGGWNCPQFKAWCMVHCSR